MDPSESIAIESQFILVSCVNNALELLPARNCVENSARNQLFVFIMTLNGANKMCTSVKT